MAEMTKEQELAYREQAKLIKKEKLYLLGTIAVMAVLIWGCVSFEVVVKMKYAGNVLVAQVGAVPAQIFNFVKSF